MIVFGAQRLLPQPLEAHVGPRGAGGFGGVEPERDERLDVRRWRRLGLLRPRPPRQRRCGRHTSTTNDEPSSRQHDAFVAQLRLATKRSAPSHEVGLGIGAQAGEARLRKVFQEAGFTHFRRAAETPVNLILEARA